MCLFFLWNVLSVAQNTAAELRLSPRFSRPRAKNRPDSYRLSARVRCDDVIGLLDNFIPCPLQRCSPNGLMAVIWRWAMSRPWGLYTTSDVGEGAAHWHRVAPRAYNSRARRRCSVDSTGQRGAGGGGAQQNTAHHALEQACAARLRTSVWLI